MGEKSDPYIFIWNYWYFLYALQTHHSPLSTNLIFYPHVVSLSLHTMQWFNCMLAAPLQRWLNLIAIYNVLNIASCAASAFAAYWCVAAITGKRLASLVTGVVLGFSPYFQAHCMGHANLVAAEFLPLYALCAYASLVTYRLRYALWAGLWMGLAGFCDLQYLAFSVLFGCVLFVGLWLYYERLDRAQFVRRIWLLIAGFIVAGLLLLPVIAPGIGQMGATSADKSHVAALFRVDLGDWVRPGMGSRLMGGNFKDHSHVEQCVTPGYTFLLLAFAGVLLCWRRARLWCFAGLCFVVLASGPFLTIFGRDLTVLTFLIAGFPGTGFGLPWQTADLIHLGSAAMVVPATFLGETVRIAMPYAWLPKVLPFLKPFRVPARFGVLVLLCVAIVAAQGLSSLLDWLRRYSSALPAAAIALVCVAVAMEYDCLPYPSFTPPAYPIYDAIGREPGHFALFELPMMGNELSAYGQVHHHKPLFKSFISRTPAGAMDTVDRYEDIARTPAMNGDGAMQRNLRELSGLGTRYVVVRLNGEDGLTKSECSNLERHMNAPLAYADSSMRVYRIDGRRVGGR
ncbi:MAG: hypothetical protein P4L33_10895 [Capsulimonadaceae bacterium]|nr:hypothetical protein [Capsulimonadaceae bacterium]